MKLNLNGEWMVGVNRRQRAIHAESDRVCDINGEGLEQEKGQAHNPVGLPFCDRSESINFPRIGGPFIRSDG
jgi:hypothetical protein